MILILISLFLNNAQANTSTKTITYTRYENLICDISNVCLKQVSNCRISDRSFEIEGNNLVGTSKISYTLKQTKTCHKKYGSNSYSGTYSYQENFSESSMIDGIRMPDTAAEVPAKNKTELRRMEECKEFREDLILTYPRC